MISDLPNYERIQKHKNLFQNDKFGTTSFMHNNSNRNRFSSPQYKSCILPNEEYNNNKMKKLKTENETENQVDFSITPPIGDKDDLDLIILFVQNSNRTGGGVITNDYVIDDAKINLRVAYLDINCKKNVLSKRSFNFKHYSITAHESFDETKFEKHKNILIILNIDISVDNDNTIVTYYAENLVPRNPIQLVITSKLFKNTHYVTFRDAYDFKNVQQRHQRRPKIRQARTEVLQAWVTNSIIGALEDFSEKSDDILDLYFTNKNKSGVNKYVSFKGQKPFKIIEFHNQQQINAVLARKHVFNKVNFLVEDYYHPKLVEYFYDQEKFESEKKQNPIEKEITNSQEEKQVKQISMKKETVEKLISSKSSQQSNQNSKLKEEKVSINDSFVFVGDDDSMQPSLLIDEFNYKLSSSHHSVLFNLLKNCQGVYSDFNLELKAHNLELVRLNGGEFEFKYLKMNESQSFEEFKANCEKILEEFCRKNGLYSNVIELPSELNNEKSLEEVMKVEYNHAYLRLKDNCIHFYGYKSSYEDLLMKIKSLSDQIPKKKSFKITLNTANNPKIIIFYYFENEYARLEDLFEEYQSKFVKSSTKDNFYIEIEGLIDVKVSQEMWYNEMLATIDNYLTAYKIERIEANIDEARSVSENVFFDKIDNSSVEVYGRATDVDKVVEFFYKKSQEFVPEINNLSLFEIRILYAIKYQSDVEKQFKNFNLKVKIDPKKSKIEFKCDNKECILEAMTKATEVFSKIVKKEFKCNPIQIEFMKTNENEVVKWLLEKKLTAVFDVNFANDAFIIYATDIEAINSCYSELSNDLIVKEINIEKKLEEKINCFIADEMTSLIWAGEKRTNGYIAKIVESGGDIKTYSMCGFKAKVESLYKRLMDYIK